MPEIAPISPLREPSAWGRFMGSVRPSDRSDYLKAAKASIYINVEQRGRVRGCELGSEKQRGGQPQVGREASKLAPEKR